MNCLFCNIEMLDEYSWRHSTISHITCQNCETKYAYDRTKKAILYYRVFAAYKEIKYVAHFNLDTQDFYLGDASQEVSKIILQLNFLPTNIAPDNFSKKLPILLLFM
jgi:hypothetical protein